MNRSAHKEIRRSNTRVLGVLSLLSAALALPLSDQHHIPPSKSITDAAADHSLSSLSSADEQPVVSWDAETKWILQVIGLIVAASVVMTAMNILMKQFTGKRGGGSVRLEGEELLSVSEPERTRGTD